MFNIILIKIVPRDEVAPKVQDILTKYGCIIKTRIGLHDVCECSKGNEGLVVLHISTKDQDKCKQLVDELSQLKGIKVKYIEL
ncbi:MAG: hypothetical protein RR620_08035 [Clostridium sp.]